MERPQFVPFPQISLKKSIASPPPPPPTRETLNYYKIINICQITPRTKISPLKKSTLPWYNSNAHAMNRFYKFSYSKKVNFAFSYNQKSDLNCYLTISN